jgi:hypothetical protein
MKFIIELEIGLFFPLKSALSKLKTDRNTKTHRRGRSKQTVRPCRRRTEIPERNPKRAQDSQSRALNPVSKAMYVGPAL